MPELAYWAIRGLAEPIRLLLTHVDVKFQNKMYPAGVAPSFDKSEWLHEKHDLGLDFPNLPYYIDGEIKITHSNAIMRHIARRHHMNGKNEEEKVKVDMLENVLQDIRIGWNRLCYNDDFERGKDFYIVKLFEKLKDLEKFLAKSKTGFLVGDLTYVDFILFELLSIHKLLVPDLMKKYPNLTKFMDKFSRLPKIIEYYASHQYKPLPVNSPSANFATTVL